MKWVWSALILAVLPIQLFAQALTAEAIQHARAGMDAQKQGDIETAIREFRAVTELQPDLAAAFVNLGAACILQRDYAGAITALQRSLELNSALPGAEQMLGAALLARGSAGEAIPHLEKAKSLDLLGVAYLEAGRLGDAIGLLGAALNQNPNDPDLLYYFGRAAGLASKEAFDSLLANAPDSARGHEAMAEEYERLRQPALAEKEYRTALGARADLPGLHLALGKLLAAGGNWPGAEAEFRAESKLRSAHSETAWRLGSALLQQGKSEEALVELKRADQLQGGMPETLLALGKAASATGDAAVAEKSWTQLLSVEKESDLAAQAHFELATLYRKAGRAEDAERELAAYKKIKSAGAR
jgi:tetratricopeptide (TPR) repeat protein